ncbi:MAG TPA: hypothetical protein VLX29_08165 [Nitrospirota bacterium]|nr:hypothetical protein [Nitrospirota bacterium]
MSDNIRRISVVLDLNDPIDKQIAIKLKKSRSGKMSDHVRAALANYYRIDMSGNNINIAQNGTAARTPPNITSVSTSIAKASFSDEPRPEGQPSNKDTVDDNGQLMNLVY